jgi:TRAP-type C4-dicarboxylate transport system permease small subunit
VIGFFALMAWAGIEVLQVLEGMTLISLTWIPIQVTQSVIPIGAILFIICELVSLPFYWRMTSQGISLEHAEIEEEVEHELKQAAKGH